MFYTFGVMPAIQLATPIRWARSVQVHDARKKYVSTHASASKLSTYRMTNDSPKI